MKTDHWWDTMGVSSLNEPPIAPNVTGKWCAVAGDCFKDPAFIQSHSAGLFICFAVTGWTVHSPASDLLVFTLIHIWVLCRKVLALCKADCEAWAAEMTRKKGKESKFTRTLKVSKALSPKLLPWLSWFVFFIWLIKKLWQKKNRATELLLSDSWKNLIMTKTGKMHS